MNRIRNAAAKWSLFISLQMTFDASKNGNPERIEAMLQKARLS